jgi:hypothetical protein
MYPVQILNPRLKYRDGAFPWIDGVIDKRACDSARKGEPRGHEGVDAGTIKMPPERVKEGVTGNGSVGTEEGRKPGFKRR